jgi:two-component system, OmpR family, phosphate regulon response regulator PhoB
VEQPKVVAVMAANPPLSSVLSAVLAASPSLRVRSFESPVALQTYMRLAPVDLLVADFDCEAAPASDLARLLRRDGAVVRRGFQIIALASGATENLKQESVASGIEEVIIKPMSPRYLLERVQSRLKRLPSQPGVRHPLPEARQWLPAAAAVASSDNPAVRRDNVVPLFGDRRTPLA